MTSARVLASLALASLVACATFQNPPPPGAELPRVVLSDGAAMPLRRWLPVATPRAVIVALHGFTDHSGAFNDAAAQWAARGFAVYAYDQRGFGASATRGVWAGRDVMVADMKEMSAQIGRAHV